MRVRLARASSGAPYLSRPPRRLTVHDLVARFLIVKSHARGVSHRRRRLRPRARSRGDDDRPRARQPARALHAAQLSPCPTAPRRSSFSPACRSGWSTTAGRCAAGWRRWRAPASSGPAASTASIMLMTVAALAIFAAAYWLGGFNEALIAPHGRAVVFQEPLRGALGVALLSHQLGYFNILPLYVVLMALAPAILALARFSPTAALFAALGAYGAVKLLGIDLPNWPEPGGWFFNPLAWQLVFTLGLLAGVRWRDAPPRRSAIIQAVCLAVTVAGALIVSDGFGLLPGLRDRRLRRARRRQAGPRRGAAGQLPRPRLPAGDDAAARRAGAHVAGRGGAEPRPPQPAGFRRQFAAVRPRPGRRRPVGRLRRRPYGAGARIRLHARLYRRFVRFGELVGMWNFASRRRAGRRRAGYCGGRRNRLWPDSGARRVADRLSGDAQRAPSPRTAPPRCWPSGPTRRPLRILAIGSSSTEGIGASRPERRLPRPARGAAGEGLGHRRRRGQRRRRRRDQRHDAQTARSPRSPRVRPTSSSGRSAPTTRSSASTSTLSAPILPPASTRRRRGACRSSWSTRNSISASAISRASSNM